MKTFESGSVELNGLERDYWFAPESTGDGVVFIIASSEYVQVYHLPELINEDYTNMTFDRSNYCSMCSEEKHSCATRLSHPRDELPYEIQELDRDDEDSIPPVSDQPVCYSCVTTFVEIARQWTREHTEIALIEGL